MGQPAEKQQELTTRPAASTALVPEVVGRGIYRDLPALNDAFDKLRERFNVCFPVMKPDIIPPMYAVALRPVSIDGRLKDDGKPASSDVYLDTAKKKYGLTKIALDKIAAAAGLSWHPAYTGRVDDNSDPLFRTYRACGVVTNLDGTPRLITAHKTLDLRDGAPHGMTTDQLREARKHIDALCESKAMNRVIRKYAFIKGLYERDELKRPFIIAALVFTGETDDPELKREVVKAMVQRATGANANLFGPAANAGGLIEDLGQRSTPPPVGLAHDSDDDDDDRAGESSSSADPDPNAPRRFIAKVANVSSQSSPPESKRRWTLHTIEFDDGTQATTFHKTPANAASDAYENDHPVAVEVKQGEFGLEIVTLTFVNDGGSES